MSLYPSLEDMKVDKMIGAQQHVIMQQQQQMSASFSAPAYTANPYPELNNASGGIPSEGISSSYPDLVNYMGLELSQDAIAANMPQYLKNNQVAVPQSTTVASAGSAALSGFQAPLSGNSVGLYRANVTHGIRELILCKGVDKKVGLRVQAINKGVFVCVVIKDSPAALGGLRFGDQILQINGTLVAGYSVDDVHKLVKKSPKNDISIIVRDRPFERTITLHKDSTGHIGFQFKNGKITSIVKESTGARNGVLTEHQLLEVDGQNCVGMKDKEITGIIDKADQIVTITIIPSFIYDHMMKKLSSSFIRGKMDHSIPDI